MGFGIYDARTMHVNLMSLKILFGLFEIGTRPAKRVSRPRGHVGVDSGLGFKMWSFLTAHVRSIFLDPSRSKS